MSVCSKYACQSYLGYACSYDIPNVSINSEKPEGRGVCIIRHRLQQFEEVTFEHQNRLFEVLDFKWLAEELEEEVLLEQYQMKASKV